MDRFLDGRHDFLTYFISHGGAGEKSAAST